MNILKGSLHQLEIVFYNKEEKDFQNKEKVKEKIRNKMDRLFKRLAISHLAIKKGN
jgi:hypothetical protein